MSFLEVSVQTKINFFVPFIMIVLGDGRKRRFLSSIKSLQFFHFRAVKEVTAFKGFILIEVPFFLSVWSFREVVLNGGFNFEWNYFEFLRLDFICLWR